MARQSKSKPTKSDIRRWVRALRSGQYAQAKGYLQGSSGYCCLGVACDLFIPNRKMDLNAFGHLTGELPCDQSDAPNWLKNISDDFSERTTNGPHRISLPGLNDDGATIVMNNGELVYLQAFTFDEIADLLELVYIHGAFDEAA